MTHTISRAEAKPADSITEQIVQRVADTTSTDPLDLPPLYESIDSDAVSTLCESADRGRSLKLEFPYAGCLVSLRVAEDVVVDIEEQY